MRRLTLFGSIAIPVLLAACAGGGTPATSPQGGAPSLMAHVPSMVDPLGRLDTYIRPHRQMVSYYACPSTGTTEYVSDALNSVIYIYRGKFVGQSPCGQIASTSLSSPRGLFVSPTSHNLYVANWGGSNVLVFPKGQTSPSNIYTDPTLQNPNDVTVTNGGIVIAANEEPVKGKERGSLSTWVHGPNGGTFVGNFPMTNDDFGLYLAVKNNSTLYYTDIDFTSGLGTLWKVSCPSGVCGAETQVAGISIGNPGGMAFNAAGQLLINDSASSTLDTFSLPNPSPSILPLPCCPVGMALDILHGHWFDTQYTAANEYRYPTFTLVGSVPNQGGAMLGIAVDP